MKFLSTALRSTSLLSTISATSSLAVATASSSASCSATSSSVAGAGAHVPIGKDGEGLYTASTKGCFDVIDTATPLVLDEITKQKLRPFGVGSPAYHIADYGTADAGTSLGLMSKMIEAVREREADKEVVVHYEDQLT